MNNTLPVEIGSCTQCGATVYEGLSHSCVTAPAAAIALPVDWDVIGDEAFVVDANGQRVTMDRVVAALNATPNGKERG